MLITLLELPRILPLLYSGAREGSQGICKKKMKFDLFKKRFVLEICAIAMFRYAYRAILLLLKYLLKLKKLLGS